MLGSLLVIDAIVYGLFGGLLFFLPHDMVALLYAGEPTEPLIFSSIRLVGGMMLLACFASISMKRTDVIDLSRDDLSFATGSFAMSGMLAISWFIDTHTSPATVFHLLFVCLFIGLAVVHCVYVILFYVLSSPEERQSKKAKDE
mmetsp:Transcript_12173/g.32772  ORF Transcript_12173/g.32772 Transcript_12173/m.32772 type:complete len:144 (-) Transcript_12173:228-659(-)